jgi:hypothetical protein
MSSEPNLTNKVDPKDFNTKTKWELQAQKDDKQRAEKSEVIKKIFNPIELTRDANKIHEVDLPVLGLLKYGELTLDDSFTIAKCKGDADKTSMAAYLMLKKAYPEMPSYTTENIGEWRKKMPMAEGAALLIFIRGTPAFLRTQSLPGLNTTQKPKKSVK